MCRIVPARSLVLSFFFVTLVDRRQCNQRRRERTAAALEVVAMLD
jgi:hypothetical protein